MSTDPQPTPCTAAPFLRRLGALLYDTLLLLAVLVFASALATALNRGPVEGENLLFRLYLLLSCYLFFAWFWSHGGQTLGMRAWRLQLRSTDEMKIGWGRALLRFTAAALSLGVVGLGFLWPLIDRQKRSWHDIISKTELCLLPKKPRNS